MKTFIARTANEQRDIFSATATAMRITPAAAEKDFWLCWVLMQLFDIPELAACLRFKGGTSLSKCFGLIDRFSEDIDLILDWTKVTSIDPLASRSTNQQHKLNTDINKNAQAYIADFIFPKLTATMSPPCQLSIDKADPHTINIEYPALFAAGYLRPQIRLEIGPLAAMMPMGIYSVSPYVAEQFPQLFTQPQAQLTAITPNRTFWEKLTILHAEAHRPADKVLPSRYSRHYYDAFQLLNSELAKDALNNHLLMNQVVEFKQRFYPSSWANYQTATKGTFKLLPNAHHIRSLQRDYQAMEEMIFGEKPEFEKILDLLTKYEKIINL